MALQRRTVARVAAALAAAVVVVVGAITMVRLARGSVADEFVLGGMAAPAGNLLFLSPDVLLCPVVNDVYRVDLGFAKDIRKVYTHPQLIERMSASPDGKRVVVASNSGLSELTALGSEFSAVNGIVLNMECTSNAAKAPFGDVAVDDDGSLTYTTREGGATVYRRTASGGGMEKGYVLYADANITRDLRYPVSSPRATAIDLIRRRVAIAYPGGVVYAPVNPLELPVNLPRPGPAVNMCAVDAPSGTLFLDDGGQFQSFSPDGRQLISVKTTGSIAGAVQVPGRNLVAVLDSRGNALASVCHLLRADTGETIATLPLAPHAGGKSVAVSPDGSRIAAATGYGDRTLLKVWKLADVLP